jgi:hypothetical protein
VTRGPARRVRSPPRRGAPGFPESANRSSSRHSRREIALIRSYRDCFATSVARSNAARRASMSSSSIALLEKLMTASEQRWIGSTVLSYRRDGAIMERNSRREWRNYFILDSDWDAAEIKFPLEHRSIRIDHRAREYYERSQVRGGVPVWDAGDPDCAKFARRFELSDLERVAGYAVIAGTRSIQYRGKRSRTENYSVWLAPSLGCTQMRVIITDHNSFGLPTLHSQFEVVSARIGEPETAAFQVPSGYRRVRGGW